MLWSIVEPNVGVICACAPNLAPLARHCLGKRPTSSPAASTALHSKPSAFLSRPFRSKQSVTLIAEDGPSLISEKRDSDLEGQTLDKKGFELEGIHVTNDFTLKEDRCSMESC